MDGIRRFCHLPGWSAIMWLAWPPRAHASRILWSKLPGPQPKKFTLSFPAGRVSLASPKIRVSRAILGRQTFSTRSPETGSQSSAQSSSARRGYLQFSTPPFENSQLEWNQPSAAISRSNFSEGVTSGDLHRSFVLVCLGSEFLGKLG